MKTIITFFALIVLSFSSYSQWISQTSGTAVQLNDIWIFTVNNVIAVGNSGTILKKTNGGTNWSPIISGTAVDLTSVFFLNANTGWIYGNGAMLKTVNGGSVWNIISNDNGFGKIFFISEQNGWCAMGGNFIKKTTNGGVSWSLVHMPVSSTMWELYFVNSSTGFAVGINVNSDSTYVYKSTNSGTNWQVFKGLSKKYPGMSVVDQNNIYLCGYDGDFIKTNNGGTSWEYTMVDNTTTLNDIIFINNTTGYVCGINGKVHATFNGGANWQSQSPGTNSSLTRVAFLGGSNETGYITGGNGSIYKTTNGGISGIQTIGNEVPNGFSLKQNYPNPFNPTTNIRIQMPKEGFAKLTVFDVTGKEVAVLVNEDLKAGEYNVDFNASNLTSGIYFYQLFVGDNTNKGNRFTDVKKMILVK